MCSRTLLGAHHVRLTQMRELTFRKFSLLKQISFTDIVVSHGSICDCSSPGDESVEGYSPICSGEEWCSGR